MCGGVSVGTAGGTGYNKMIGFGAPFSPDAFDMYFNPLPRVPLDPFRVLDLAAATTAKPGLMKGGPMVLHANCVHGEQTSAGNLVMLKPCEMPHSILHNVATAILNGAQESELARRTGVLPSKSKDIQYQSIKESKLNF